MGGSPLQSTQSRCTSDAYRAPCIFTSLIHIYLQWPPPPRATPIIVPSHLTSTHKQPQQSSFASSDSPAMVGVAEAGVGDVKMKQACRTKSSLHRAVMEKLEVQKAMNDLAGDGV